VVDEVIKKKKNFFFFFFPLYLKSDKTNSNTKFYKKKFLTFINENKYILGSNKIDLRIFNATYLYNIKK
jgi:hypothetical protein